MTVVVTAVFHPLDGHRADLIDALRSSIPAVHAEPGCVLYAIHDASDGTITMIEKWTTPELLAEHAAGPAVADLDRSVGPHIAEPTTVVTMDPLPAGTDSQGLL
jgi:quinol monooxygenase YgiN